MSYQVDFQSGGVESNPSIPGKTSISLPPSVVDQSSTSLTLTGKGVPNYGEIQQENFIRLLENFASKTAPLHPTIGQIWFDTVAAQAKVFSINSTWIPLGGVTSSATAPSTPAVGTLWYDSSSGVLKVWNGTSFVAVGTNSSSSQPTSPTAGQLWYDTINNVLKIYDGSNFVPVGGGVAGGSTPPSNAPEGTLWYSSVDHVLYTKVDSSTVAADTPLYYTTWAQVWPTITRYASYTEYNALAARINKVVGAPSVSGTSSEVGDNQWGWGQTDVLEIFTSMNAPSTFNNTKWILLASRLRKALRHTTVDETTIPSVGMIDDGRGPSSTATAYTPSISWKSGWAGMGIVSLSTNYSALQTAVTALETNKYATNPLGMSITNVRTDSSIGSTWASSRALDTTYTFASDAAAKAFFNSGSSIRHTVVIPTGTGVGYEWYNLMHLNSFDSLGIVVDARGTRVGITGSYITTAGAATGTTASSVGFYDLGTSFTTMLILARGGAYGTGSFVLFGKYDPSTFTLTLRMGWNEDYAAGQSVNKITVTQDIRTPASAVSGAPHIDSPVIALPTVATSGSLLTLQPSDTTGAGAAGTTAGGTGGSGGSGGGTTGGITFQTTTVGSIQAPQVGASADITFSSSIVHVGDLAIAVVSGPIATAISPPSGWTTHVASDSGAGGGLAIGTMGQVNVYSKIMTQSDLDTPIHFYSSGAITVYAGTWRSTTGFQVGVHQISSPIATTTAGGIIYTGGFTPSVDVKLIQIVCVDDTAITPASSFAAPIYVGDSNMSLKHSYRNYLNSKYIDVAFIDGAANYPANSPVVTANSPKSVQLSYGVLNTMSTILLGVA